MLPMVMATPRMTVPSITMAPPPADRTTTPARTPRRVSVMATSAPSRRAAREASGAASEKHSTGIPVSRPSSTGENPRSSCIGSHHRGHRHERSPHVEGDKPDACEQNPAARESWSPVGLMGLRGRLSGRHGKAVSSLSLLSRCGQIDGKSGHELPTGPPTIHFRYAHCYRYQSRWALPTPGASRNCAGCATHPTPLAMTCWICGWW